MEIANFLTSLHDLGRNPQTMEIPPRPPLAKGGWGDLKATKTMVPIVGASGRTPMIGRAQLAPTMQGAEKPRREAHLQVRPNDEVAAQRRRWAFYEAINPGSHFLRNHASPSGIPVRVGFKKGIKKSGITPITMVAKKNSGYPSAAAAYPPMTPERERPKPNIVLKKA